MPGATQDWADRKKGLPDYRQSDLTASRPGAHDARNHQTAGDRAVHPLQELRAFWAQARSGAVAGTDGALTARSNRQTTRHAVTPSTTLNRRQRSLSSRPKSLDRLGGERLIDGRARNRAMTEP